MNYDEDYNIRCGIEIEEDQHPPLDSDQYSPSHTNDRYYISDMKYNIRDTSWIQTQSVVIQEDGYFRVRDDIIPDQYINNDDMKSLLDVRDNLLKYINEYNFNMLDVILIQVVENDMIDTWKSYWNFEEFGQTIELKKGDCNISFRLREL